MIAIDMGADLLDKQIEMLKHFPEISAKHFKPALQTAVNAISARVSPSIPMRTGHAAETFGTKVTGRKIETLKGMVGWYDKNDAWYIRFPEGGTKAHEVNARGGRITKARAAAGGGATTHMRFPGTSQGADWIFVRSIHHPGSGAQQFMQRGNEAAKSIVDQALGAAAEGVVKELAI